MTHNSSTTSPLSELSEDIHALSIEFDEARDTAEIAAESSNIIARFADPTYDVTFKKVFGQDSDSSKKMFCSFANSVFTKYHTQYKEIDATNIVIINNVFIPVEENRIISSVDILCKDEHNRQFIAFEMQRSNTSYFLVREQHYLGKLIGMQAQQGDGQKYDTLFDIYLMVIAKENIFTGKTKLAQADAEGLFHLDFGMSCIQTNEPLPNNKLHLTFCELSKFRKSTEYNDIHQESDMEFQWLYFLSTCSSMKEVPEHADIIKEAYNIMETTNWTTEEKVLYDRQKDSVINLDDLIQELEQSKRQVQLDQEELEQTRKQAKLDQEAAQKERIESKIDAIEGLKDAIKDNLSHDKLVKFFKIFKEEEISSLESHLNNPEHPVCDCDSAELAAQLMGVGVDVAEPSVL